ncbi:hypothetical protein SMW93_003657 [Cronobacter sakazakii]|nr:hypothetical protein [Cronobacter sakazakii]ELY4752693.1 hypothetical protein [Cronobacter sakazakii]ELY5779490.1 hypothetical protein [Cronobacter sakazakii]
MREISQEALAAACEEKVKQLEFSVKQSAFDSVRQELQTELAIARVALAALRERAEPVVYMNRFTGRAFELEQQPAWDGEGLPPVGTKCEFKCATGVWSEVEITAIARNGLCFVEPGKDGENYVAFSREFRPIRSEADKRRDEAIAALVDFKIGYHSYPKAAEEYLREVTALYDAILRGDIPHIRIEHAA